MERGKTFVAYISAFFVVGSSLMARPPTCFPVLLFVGWFVCRLRAPVALLGVCIFCVFSSSLPSIFLRVISLVRQFCEVNSRLIGFPSCERSHNDTEA